MTGLAHGGGEAHGDGLSSSIGGGHTRLDRDPHPEIYMRASILAGCPGGNNEGRSPSRDSLTRSVISRRQDLTAQVTESLARKRHAPALEQK